jgi:hypothetical protein
MRASNALTALDGVAAATATAITEMQSGHIDLLLTTSFTGAGDEFLDGAHFDGPKPNDRNL